MDRKVVSSVWFSLVTHQTLATVSNAWKNIRLGYQICGVFGWTRQRKPILATGDYNVAHNEIDLANQQRRSPGFTDEACWIYQPFSNWLRTVPPHSWCSRTTWWSCTMDSKIMQAGESTTGSGSRMADRDQIDMIDSRSSPRPYPHCLGDWTLEENEWTIKLSFLNDINRKIRHFYCDLLGFSVEYRRPEENFYSQRDCQHIEEGEELAQWPIFRRSVNISFGIWDVLSSQKNCGSWLSYLSSWQKKFQ